MTRKVAVISVEGDTPQDLLKIFESTNKWRGYTTKIIKELGVVIFLPCHKSSAQFFVVIRGNNIYANEGIFLAKEILEKQGVFCKIAFEKDLPTEEAGESWEKAKTMVLG